MNKLREKFGNVEIMFEGQIGFIKYDEGNTAEEELEQITDDFSVKFAEFLYDHRRNNQTMFWKPAKELLQIFKTQYYGKI